MVFTSPNPSSVDLSRVRLAIRSLQPQLVEWRRRLHQKPELGFQEKLTAEFISSKLQGWGIEHQTGIAQTGIVATITGEKPTSAKVRSPSPVGWVERSETQQIQ